MTETDSAKTALAAFIHDGFPSFGELDGDALPAKAFAFALLEPLVTDDSTLPVPARDAFLRHIEYYDDEDPPAVPYRSAAIALWLWLDGQPSQATTEIDSLRPFSMRPVAAGEAYPLV